MPASLTVPPAARTAAIRAGPLLTIVGELSIGLLLFAPATARLRPLRKFGVGLALLFHLGIAVTPPPNNISEYDASSANPNPNPNPHPHPHPDPNPDPNPNPNP